MDKVNKRIDIAENELYEKYPDILNILLFDQTTKKEIFWATDNYQSFGYGYDYFSPIKISSIVSHNGKIIMPRVLKNKEIQTGRTKDMAEVFTPVWVCNLQNNIIDNAWFQKKDVFNKPIVVDDVNIWKTNSKKIIFPRNKTWLDYIKDKRLEIACGEAPYITSRYDTTTGEYIVIEERIGILDRKLRVINENVDSTTNWLSAVILAYQNTYAYEWQGDSLLLARESMLYTFIENYILKFNKKPPYKYIEKIAEIISWNVWQMDGLKGVIPMSCRETKNTQNILLEDGCIGCLKNKTNSHNGIYCLIKDWSESPNGRIIKFIDILKD